MSETLLVRVEQTNTVAKTREANYDGGFTDRHSLQKCSSSLA